MEGAFGSAVTRRWPFLSAQNYLSAPARRGLERQWVIHHPGDDVAPWGWPNARSIPAGRAGLLDGERDPHSFLVVGLLLGLVVDVAGQHVAARLEVEGLGSLLAWGELRDLADGLDALAFLVHGPVGIGRQVDGREVGLDDDELMVILRSLVRDVEGDLPLLDGILRWDHRELLE